MRTPSGCRLREVAVAVDVGREIRHRVLVVQVAGRGAKRRADEVRAVALVLVEGERVADRPARERGARSIETGETPGPPGHDDPVRAGRPQAGSRSGRRPGRWRSTGRARADRAREHGRRPSRTENAPPAPRPSTANRRAWVCRSGTRPDSRARRRSRRPRAASRPASVPRPRPGRRTALPAAIVIPANRAIKPRIRAPWSPSLPAYDCRLGCRTAQGIGCSDSCD